MEELLTLSNLPEVLYQVPSDILHLLEELMNSLPFAMYL